MEIPWQSSGQGSVFPLHGALVQSLIVELRSHKFNIMIRKKKKTTYTPPIDPSIRLLSIYTKELKSGSQRDTRIAIFITDLFTIPRMWNQYKYPLIDEWIKKIWYINTMEYFSASREKEILIYATTWMILQDMMLSEMSFTEG